MQARVSRLPSPIAAYDFQIEPGEDPTEKIQATIRELKPEKAIEEIGLSFGKKDGKLSCFVEFYGEAIEEGEEVITDEMRLNADPEYIKPSNEQ